MALSTTTTAILNEAQRWENFSKRGNTNLREKLEPGPLDIDDSQINGQRQKNLDDFRYSTNKKGLSFVTREFTKKQPFQNEEIVKNELPCTYHENISGDQAWELIKEAVLEHDLDDVKTAAEMYVKFHPDVTYQALEQAFRDQDIEIYLIAMEKELAENFTNKDLQGNVDKTYSISWRWSPRPMRPREIPLWPGTREENLRRLADAGEPTNRGIPKCINCDALGHIRKDCPEDEIKRERVIVMCLNCQEPGHRIRDCPKPRNDRFACKNCHQSGHNSRECPEPRSLEGVECNKCKEFGHFSRDCPQETLTTCRNCDEVGHMAKECPHPRDYSRVKCNNCEKYGHTKVRCKEPIMEDIDVTLDNSNGKENEYSKTNTPNIEEWDNKATNEVPLSTGGWDNQTNVAGEESWGTPAVSSENISW